MTACMSDHFLVESKMVVAKELCSRVKRCKREVVKVEELCKQEKKLEYERRVKEVYDVVRGENPGSLEVEWSVFKETTVGCAGDVCGKKVVGGGIRKGSEWWNETVKGVVEEKKRAFEEWLQSGSLEKYESYKQKRARVKRVVNDAKRAANVRWGERFGMNFEQDKKRFWKEVRRVRKGHARNEETVKDENGHLVRGDAARKRWGNILKGY